LTVRSGHWTMPSVDAGRPEYPFFFTWTRQDRARPLELVGGEGVWLETSDGGRWLDLGALVYQVGVGHGRQRMIEAVRGQASRLCVSAPHAVYPEKTELARKLLDLAPEGFADGKVFFTLGGSDANENAIKIARLFTGRHKLVARYRSYHGATMGAVTLSGDWRRPPVEPGLAGVVHVDDLGPDGGPRTRIPRTLELEGPDTVAAVFVESIVGANGVIIPPPGYLAELREACDRHGVILVVDEVLAGFGRTGRWFGFEHQEGVVPDVITLGKALTGGYGTLGAVLVHGRVARHFDDHPLVAGLTHYAHPLGVAAAREAIALYEDEGLVENAARLEPVLRSGLDRIAKKHGVVRDNRVIGLLSATELDLDEVGFHWLGEALRRHRVHAHVQPRASSLILSPPLCITENELEQGLSLIDRAIAEALE